MANVMAHELNETITDPDMVMPGFTSTPLEKLAIYVPISRH